MAIENEMSPSGQLIDWIKRQPGLAGLIGDKAYPDLAPEETPAPYMVVTQVWADRNMDSDGYGGLSRFGLQVDSYAATRSAVTAISETLRRCLHGYSGPMGSVHCQMADLTNDFSERLQEVELSRVSQDVTLIFTER